MAKSTAKKKPTPAKKPVFKKTTLVKPDAKTSSIAKANSPAIAIKPNATSFKLVDDVQLPPRIRKGGASPYPFASMAIGQSFMVAAVIERSIYSSEEEADKAQNEECRKVANRLSGAVRRFTKHNTGYKFAVRTVSTGKALGFDADHGIVVQRVEESKGE